MSIITLPGEISDIGTPLVYGAGVVHSFQFWIKIDGTGDQFIDISGAATSVNFFGGIPRVFENGADRVVGVTAVPSNTWTHLSFTFDGTQWRIYFNGVLDATGAAYATGVYEYNNIEVNASTGATSANWSEIRFFDTTLSPTQITNNWNKRSPTGATGLVRLYRCDQNAPDTLIDDTQTNVAQVDGMLNTASWDFGDDPVFASNQDVYLFFGGGQSNYNLDDGQDRLAYSASYGPGGLYTVQDAFDGAQPTNQNTTAYVWNVPGSTTNAPAGTRWDYISPLVNSQLSPPLRNINTCNILAPWAIDAYGDDSCFFIQRAVDNTSLFDDWNILPWAGSLGDLWFDQIELALTDLQTNGHPVTGNPVNIYIAQISWLQGEDDAQSGIGATVYGQNLVNLFMRIKEKLGFADTEDSFPIMIVKPPYVEGSASGSGHNTLNNIVNRGYDFAGAQWAATANGVASVSSAQGANLPDNIHMDEQSAETVWEDAWTAFDAVSGPSSFVLWDDGGATRTGTFVANGSLDPFALLTAEIQDARGNVREEFDSGELPFNVTCNGTASTEWISSKDSATASGNVTTFQPTLADSHTLIAFDPSNGANYTGYCPYGTAYAQVNLSRSTTLNVLGETPEHWLKGTVGAEIATADIASILETPQFINLDASAKNGEHTGAANAATLTDSTQSWTTNELVGYEILNLTDGSSGTITANTSNTVTATLSGGSDNDWDTGDVFRIQNPNTVVRNTIGDNCLICDEGISLNPSNGMRILAGGSDDPIDETTDFIRIAKWIPASNQNLNGFIIGSRQNFGNNTGSMLGQGASAGAGFSLDPADNSSAMWRATGSFNETRLNTLTPSIGNFGEIVVSAMIRIQDGGDTKYYNYNYNGSQTTYIEEVTNNGVVSSNSSSIGEPPGAGNAGVSGSVFEVIEMNINNVDNPLLYNALLPNDTNIISMLDEIYQTTITTPSGGVDTNIYYLTLLRNGGL